MFPSFHAWKYIFLPREKFLWIITIKKNYTSHVHLHYQRLTKILLFSWKSQKNTPLTLQRHNFHDSKLSRTTHQSLPGLPPSLEDTRTSYSNQQPQILSITAHDIKYYIQKQGLLHPYILLIVSPPAYSNPSRDKASPITLCYPKMCDWNNFEIPILMWMLL